MDQKWGLPVNDPDQPTWSEEKLPILSANHS
jgi:hypothetical protein